MTSITFFFVLIPVLGSVLLAVNFLLAPHTPYQEKNSAFECGFHSFLGQNRSQFSISFFIFGLLFLLFDLEILLIYPFAVTASINDIYGLSFMLIFFLLLTLGFVFELGKQALKIESRQTTNYVTNKPLVSGFLLNTFAKVWHNFTSRNFWVKVITMSILTFSTRAFINEFFDVNIFTQYLHPYSLSSYTGLIMISANLDTFYPIKPLESERPSFKFYFFNNKNKINGNNLFLGATLEGDTENIKLNNYTKEDNVLFKRGSKDNSNMSDNNRGTGRGRPTRGSVGNNSRGSRNINRNNTNITNQSNNGQNTGNTNITSSETNTNLHGGNSSSNNNITTNSTKVGQKRSYLSMLELSGNNNVDNTSDRPVKKPKSNNLPGFAGNKNILNTDSKSSIHNFPGGRNILNNENINSAKKPEKVVIDLTNTDNDLPKGNKLSGFNKPITDKPQDLASWRKKNQIPEKFIQKEPDSTDAVSKRVYKSPEPVRTKPNIPSTVERGLNTRDLAAIRNAEMEEWGNKRSKERTERITANHEAHKKAGTLGKGPNALPPVGKKTSQQPSISTESNDMLPPRKPVVPLEPTEVISKNKSNFLRYVNRLKAGKKISLKQIPENKLSNKHENFFIHLEPIPTKSIPSNKIFNLNRDLNPNNHIGALPKEAQKFFELRWFTVSDVKGVEMFNSLSSEEQRLILKLISQSLENEKIMDIRKKGLLTSNNMGPSKKLWNCQTWIGGNLTTREEEIIKEYAIATKGIFPGLTQHKYVFALLLWLYKRNN